MNIGFADVVEEVKQLSTEEKQELRSLIDSYLIEERRHEIFENFEASRAELERGELKFSSNAEDLRKILND